LQLPVQVSGQGLDGKRPDDPSSKEFTSAAALADLQAQHLGDSSCFVVQAELNCLIDEAGGGPCASAAAIDSLQVLRLLSGQKAMQNPHKAVIAAFANDKNLLKGRVSNQQFVNTLNFYEKYLDGGKIKVDVESAPDYARKNGGRAWP